MRRLRYMLKHVQGLLAPVFTTTAFPGKNKGMTVIETAALPVRRLEWQVAEARKIAPETPYVRSLLLHVPDWAGHLPSQYVDIRLGREQDCLAHRSYSIASPPEEELIAL